MAWDFEYYEGDGFVPMMFGDGFEDDAFDDSPAFFQMAPAPQEVAPPQSVGCTQAPYESRLVVENNELRQTAMSLKEKFAQMTSLNERLKGQLEECRSNFKNVMFAGFGNSGK